MDVYEVPLNGKSERFTVNLPEGITLTAAAVWRNRGGGGWMLDLGLPDGTPLVTSIPLVGGIDLLASFRHLGIPGSLFIMSDGPDPMADPTYDGLGTDSRLFYVPTSSLP